MNIYVDESGELGFHPKSSAYYVIAAVSLENPKPLTNAIRRFNGRLIRGGWPRALEIKAAHLFYAPKNPKIPTAFKYKHDTSPLLIQIVDKVSSAADHIDVAVIKKDKLYTHLRQLPFGVLHNYYCGLILVPAILGCSQAEVYVDKRSKERHSMRHFDGYIETKVHEAAFHSQQATDLCIRHVESHMVYGIAAADYLAWAVFRRMESGDGRFLQLFRNRIRNWTGLY